MIEEKHSGWMRLQHWYRGPLGRLYSESEAIILEQTLANLFGYRIVTLGFPTGRDLAETSPILNRYRVDSIQPLSGTELDLLAEPDYLPFASDCIDTVVMPHVLEFAKDPTAILKEIDRILVPEGHVIILGFNPFSLWGVWRFLSIEREQSVWRTNFVSINRVREWLCSLGFEVVSTQYRFYRPPLRNNVLLRKLAFMERTGARWWSFWGASYVLLAKKRVSTLTLIRPRWRSRQNLLGEGIARPTSRNRSGG